MFHQIKSVLSEEKMLRILYRIGAETELHTNASSQGLGAILLQKNAEDRLFHPIYYAS